MLEVYHQKRCLELLGQGFAEVHSWLDRFYPAYDGWHRIILHHRVGLDLLVREMGEGVRAAGELHIRDDWQGDLPDDPMAVVKEYYPMPPGRELAHDLVNCVWRAYGKSFGLLYGWLL